MKLSYAITVCNEFEETITLLTQLWNYKGENSEIVVLLDTPKASPELIEYLEVQASADKITLIESEFNHDFAAWKNFLNSYCKGEWIFQLDADEHLDVNFIHNLEEILDNNDTDLVLVPRINIVNGIKYNSYNPPQSAPHRGSKSTSAPRLAQSLCRPSHFAPPE